MKNLLFLGVPILKHIRVFCGLNWGHFLKEAREQEQPLMIGAILSTKMRTDAQCPIVRPWFCAAELRGRTLYYKNSKNWDTTKITVIIVKMERYGFTLPEFIQKGGGWNSKQYRP